MKHDLPGWHDVPYAEIEALAREHGTPFYLLDADCVAARIERVRRALQHRFHVYFAVKANPNRELLRALKPHVDGLDVSSRGEIEQAMRAGFDAGTLSFAGPGKTDDELRFAVASGAGCISIESQRELEACIDTARRSGAVANILVRVNPLLANRSFGMKMGGKPIQFGVDEELLPAAIDLIERHRDVLNFRGLHIYAGSQCFDVAGLVQGVADALRIVRDVEAKSSLVCTIVNLGGGFGFAHTGADREFDIEAAAGELLRLRDEAGSDRTLLFELGRFLVADAGIYVSRVVSTKHSRGTQFVVTDGGLNHHLAAAGTFGATLRGNFPLVNVSRPASAPSRCTVAGPSCNPTDLIGIDVELGAPQPGDLIAVLKSGSYGLSASPLLFLGRDTPVELVRVGGRTLIGRRRYTILDFN